MSGLEIILYVYLAGWVGTSSVAAYRCDDSTYRMSKNECRTIAVIGGAVWPAAAFVVAKEKLEAR